MMYLIEGPVGAGKSTYAMGLADQRRALHLNLDEWMVVLFRPDRPEIDFMGWYSERKQRCIDQIWATARKCHQVQVPVVLELGLVTQADRLAFYEQADESDVELQIHVLDAPREVRRLRVQERNLEQGATFQMEVSDEIFTVADSAWQAPDETEQQQRVMIMIDTT